MEVFVIINAEQEYYKSDGRWTPNVGEAKWFGLKATATKTLKRLEATATIKAITVGEAHHRIFIYN